MSELAITPPTSSQDEDLQNRYNQELAEKLTKISAKIRYINDIPTGLDAAGIINYLQQVEGV